jgi:hypothetical protein
MRLLERLLPSFRKKEYARWRAFQVRYFADKFSSAEEGEWFISNLEQGAGRLWGPEADKNIFTVICERPGGGELYETLTDFLLAEMDERDRKLTEENVRRRVDQAKRWEVDAETARLHQEFSEMMMPYAVSLWGPEAGPRRLTLIIQDDPGRPSWYVAELHSELMVHCEAILENEARLDAVERYFDRCQNPVGPIDTFYEDSVIHYLPELAKEDLGCADGEDRRRMIDSRYRSHTDEDRGEFARLLAAANGLLA